MPRITRPQEDIILAEYERSGSIRRAAAAAGCSFGAAKRVVRSRAPGQDAPAEAAPFSVKESGPSRTVEGVSDFEVRTLDDALRFARVDPAAWRVKDWECTGWTTVLKLRDIDEKGRTAKETPAVKQNWRVRVRLERADAAADPVLASLESLCRRLEGKAAAPPAGGAAVPVTPCLAVVDLVDAHFGKLAWGAETGQDYDLEIAERVYRDAVAELLSRCRGFDVEEFLLPLGSDFLHVDNLGGTTTAGTPQDVDGRLGKILEAAELAVVWAVVEMAARGRVAVRWVPSNHDRLLSYCLARTVRAYFKNHPHVTVDVAPTARKYHRYHSTLIGLTHGDQERPASLPAIMATEAAADWSRTTCREWHVGHMHKSKRVDHVGLDTHGGVPVRTLRSLSAVDAWHYRRGFVGTARSAEMYVYGRDAGLLANFYANVRGAA